MTMKRVMFHPRLGQRYISYILAHETVIDSDLDKLHDMIDHASKVVVLTGAGASTENAIPDYRS
jgi:NAD-dependent deacetylase sirtuin 4